MTRHNRFAVELSWGCPINEHGAENEVARTTIRDAKADIWGSHWGERPKMKPDLEVLSSSKGIGFGAVSAMARHSLKNQILGRAGYRRRWVSSLLSLVDPVQIAPKHC